MSALGVLAAVEAGADDGPVTASVLERWAQPMDVGATLEHDEAEGGSEVGAVEHGARDTARGAPWAEVLMDEAEVGRA